MTDEMLDGNGPLAPAVSTPRIAAMAPRIVIIGGGSYQWVPKLLVDIVNTPSLAEAEIVLQDIDPGAARTDGRLRAPRRRARRASA